MSVRDTVSAGPDTTAPAKTLAYVLTFSCPDRPGIVYAVSKFLVEHDCNIIESQQFDDLQTRTFFMRVEFEAVGGGTLDLEALHRGFAPIAAGHGMRWRLLDAGNRQRVLIMVSKYGHCLNDLLFRARNGRLNVDPVAVVSNHPDLGILADNYDVPFRHIPVTKDNKPAAEAELLDLVDTLDVQLVILARYMQILSEGLCDALEGKAINIHHSMLPAFKGARPYYQARARGVKVVGATAHYVTPDLDEGPIIDQQVARVDHSMSAAEVTALGQDNECLALARAVRWHSENRVLLDGIRTVVFA